MQLLSRFLSLSSRNAVDTCWLAQQSRGSYDQAARFRQAGDETLPCSTCGNCIHRTGCLTWRKWDPGRLQTEDGLHLEYALDSQQERRPKNPASLPDTLIAHNLCYPPMEHHSAQDILQSERI